MGNPLTRAHGLVKLPDAEIWLAEDGKAYRADCSRAPEYDSAPASPATLDRAEVARVLADLYDADHTGDDGVDHADDCVIWREGARRKACTCDLDAHVDEWQTNRRASIVAVVARLGLSAEFASLTRDEGGAK